MSLIYSIFRLRLQAEILPSIDVMKILPEFDQKAVEKYGASFLPILQKYSAMKEKENRDSYGIVKGKR